MDTYIKEINSMESKILDKIDILKRYGIDIAGYKHELDDIKKSFEKKEKEVSKGDKAVLKMQKDTVYLQAIKKLKSLESRLDNKQSYLTLHFKNSSLYKETQSIIDFDIDRIHRCSTECISLLRETYEANTNNVAESKKMIEDVYKTAYEVIKLELLSEGESDLLDYIVDNKLGIEYINDVVREHIESLKANNKYDENIEKVIDEISIEGINYNYANIELLLLILLKKDNRIINSLNAKAAFYDLEVKSLEEENDSLDSLEYRSENRSIECKDRIKKDRKNAIIAAVFLITNLISLKGLPSSMKTKYTDTTYLTKREAYDTFTGQTRTEEYYIKKGDDEFAKVYVYEPVNSNGERKVTTYKMADADYENIEDYVSAITNEDSYNEHTVQKVDFNYGSQLTSERYTTVERMNYGDAVENFDQEGYNKAYRRWLALLIALIGYFGISISVYILYMIKNKQILESKRKEREKYSIEKNKNDKKIKKYKKLKEEVEKLIEKQKNGTLDAADYMQLIRK